MNCVDHLGNGYKSFNQLAKAYNISYETLKYRLNIKKWTLEKALTTPSPRFIFLFRGKIYSSASECIEEFKLTNEEVNYIMNLYEFSQKQQAIEFLLDERENEYVCPDDVRRIINKVGWNWTRQSKAR